MTAVEPSPSAPAKPRPRRLLVIHNPAAGQCNRHRYREVLRHLRLLGCQVEVRETAGRGDAESLARQAQEADCDAVVVAGGDGTINEAANGLVGSDLPLAVLPLGTANVLAAEIGMPRSPAAIARAIAEGTARTVHFGLANGRCFLMMAGIGFDAHVVANVDPRLKRIIGKLAFFTEVIARMMRFPFRPYRVTVDGRAYEAASAVIANGHFYGGRFTCAPLARLNDPLLQVCLFLNTSRWSVLRYGLWLMLGRLPELPDVLVVPGVRVTVEGAIGEPVQGDGDVIGSAPLSAYVAGSTMRLIAP